MSVLDLHPYVVKPNRDELEQTLARPLDSDQALLAGMRELNARGARWAVVTQGPGPVFVSSSERAFRAEFTAIDRPVNPIGCGDAMSAALAWAIRRGDPIEDAVRLGIAASLQNLQDILPCRLDRDWVEQQAGEVRIQQL